MEMYLAYPVSIPTYIKPPTSKVHEDIPDATTSTGEVICAELEKSAYTPHVGGIMLPSAKVLQVSYRYSKFRAGCPSDYGALVGSLSISPCVLAKFWEEARAN